jgi:hypothetical protein
MGRYFSLIQTFIPSLLFNGYWVTVFRAEADHLPPNAEVKNK